MKIRQKPDWLKTGIPGGENYVRLMKLVREKNLHTICTSGKCPNMGECWKRGTATLMILGNICTRACKFCATPTGRPLPPDNAEPLHIAETVNILELKYCVITSVDRDDLSDKGAAHWAETIKEVRRLNPHTKIEVLIPDFDGNEGLLDAVLCAKPDIVGHNLETVRRITPLVRSRARYDTSLNILRMIHEKGFSAKSGIMAGLGETNEEVTALMHDLISSGCKRMTIGQYLQPTPKHLPVTEYIQPSQFEEWKQEGLRMGFVHIESGPLVRSSYMAETGGNCITN